MNHIVAIHFVVAILSISSYAVELEQIFKSGQPYRITTHYTPSFMHALKELVEEERARDERTETGFSPVKDVPQSFSMGSSVTRNIVAVNMVAAQRDPVAKRRLQFADTAYKFTPILREHSDFSTGRWAFVDPFSKKATVLVDADNSGWDKLVHEFVLSDYHADSKQAFLMSMVNFLHEKLHRIKKLTRSPRRTFVCRHFSTVALPLFSKIFAAPDVEYGGSIRLVTAGTLNHLWRDAEDGHAWNLVQFTDADDDEFWLVDAFNRRIVNLSESNDLFELSLSEFNSRSEIATVPLFDDVDYFDWAQVTVDKFAVHGVQEGALYHDNEYAEQQVMINLMANYPFNFSDDGSAIIVKRS